MLELRFVSKGMLAALILSVIIAFMISIIPNFQILHLNHEFPVFKQQKHISLNDENIVDFMASFSLNMQIKKVNWKHDTLSVDFLIDRNHHVDTNIIYKDLYAVIEKTLVQTTNAKEVLVRVFLDDMDKIFVAVSAHKKDILNNPSMKLDSSMMYKDFLEEYFGLIYGNLIK